MPSAPSTSSRSLRAQIEGVSRPALARLHALPRLLIPLATIALIAVGVFAPPPVALAAFAVLFLFIAWIAYLSWPVVPATGRLMRLFMLALIIALALLSFRGN